MFLALILLPSVAIGTLVVSGLAYHWLSRRESAVAYLAPVVSALLAVAVVWAVVAIGYDAASMTEIWCVRERPSWWPSWLPL